MPYQLELGAWYTQPGNYKLLALVRQQGGGEWFGQQPLLMTVV
jgi:hypothetical protein